MPPTPLPLLSEKATLFLPSRCLMKFVGASLSVAVLLQALAGVNAGISAVDTAVAGVFNDLDHDLAVPGLVQTPHGAFGVGSVFNNHYGAQVYGGGFGLGYGGFGHGLGFGGFGAYGHGFGGFGTYGHGFGRGFGYGRFGGFGHGFYDDDDDDYYLGYGRFGLGPRGYPALPYAAAAYAGVGHFPAPYLGEYAFSRPIGPWAHGYGLDYDDDDDFYPGYLPYWRRPYGFGPRFGPFGPRFGHGGGFAAAAAAAAVVH